MFFKKKKNYNKTILIDIIDVISNLEDFKLKQGIFYAKRNGFKLEDPNQFNTVDIYNWTDELENKFWEFSLPQFLNTFQPKPLAREALNKLYNQNFEIILLCRTEELSFDKKNEKFYLNNIQHWLKKQNILYSKCIFSNDDILKIIEKNNVEFFITANLKLIDKVNQICKTIVFNTNYNTILNESNYCRVSNWKEAYYLIEKKTNL